MGEGCVDYSVEEQQCRNMVLEGFKVGIALSALATGEARVGGDFAMLSGMADELNAKIWSTGTSTRNVKTFYLPSPMPKKSGHWKRPMWWPMKPMRWARSVPLLLFGLGPVPQIVTAVLGDPRPQR